MTLLTTIQTTVDQSLLTKIGRFFNGSVTDVLTEAIQNSRRAGASHIHIDRVDRGSGPVLSIRDDGRGIDEPAKFLRLGDSGWDAEIARREDPAGMGVFSLAGHRVTVRSYAAKFGASWQVTIPPDAWESGEPLDLSPASLDKGTEIEIDLPKAWADQLEEAVRAAARFCPVPISFCGKRQVQEQFLRDAVRVEDWNGCRIGIFADPHRPPHELVRINFHGLTVPCRLPHIQSVDDHRGWYAKVDIVDAPHLQLVLPARKEMVQKEALVSLREACEAAIYRTIAREGYHRLAHRDWLRAKDLGVLLPDAAPWLFAWRPRSADTDDDSLGERVAGEPMILMPTAEAHIEQCVARALTSGRPLGAIPVDPIREFAGYAWYDALPRVLSWNFRIERGDNDVLEYGGDGPVPSNLDSGRVDAITLECAVRANGEPEASEDVMWLPADIVIIPSDCWCGLEDVAILLSTDCAISPADLACLLVDACFISSDDSDADSHETQETAFEMQARFTANLLLLGEDTAVIERVREAIREHVSWLIPDDRMIVMRAVNYKVEASFADNDDASASNVAA
ncbi:MAG: ATP-binding protein [Sphingobium sp.]|nr:ATP-binding protein [Sphingobium sp.]